MDHLACATCVGTGYIKRLANIGILDRRGIIDETCPQCSGTGLGPGLSSIHQVLTRIADRLDKDAEQFDEMVKKGKGLNA